MANDDENTNGIDNSTRNTIHDNSVIMMFTSSLVKHAASPQLRLPANFVGVHSVRQDFRKSSSISTPQSKYENSSNVDDINKDKISRLKATNDVKFCVIDENGIERRMTKAEKKAKKFQMAQAKKEAKKESAAKKKRKVEQITGDEVNDEESKLQFMEKNLQSSSKEIGATSTRPYHQLPLNPTTIDQELAEFQGKRGITPPAILSPPMALRFLSKQRTLLMTNTLEQSVKNTSCHDGDNSILVYDHNLSQEWANRLKRQCVLPAEAVRQKEDLRPLAYRLQPEPWQRLRPSLDENPVLTTNRSNMNAIQKPLSITAEKGVPIACDTNPKPCDWVPITCRPRMMPSSSSERTATIVHDDILSIVFEYIHRKTPYYISCGAKFGSDFLVYDGPRDKRHAFAGLRVLSRFTSSMTAIPSKSTPKSSPLQNDGNGKKPASNNDVVQLPLPTAYSLTGFVRCLNTAGKLALLATVDEVSDNDDTYEKKSLGRSVVSEKKRYRVAFVDVALEKVLDVHKRKNRGRSDTKKLQKRRDVTKTLSKR